MCACVCVCVCICYLSASVCVCMCVGVASVIDYSIFVHQAFNYLLSESSGP